MPAVQDPGDRAGAMERAARLLAVRARSRRELCDRLLGAGYSPSAVEAVERRLTELGLIDDTEFALQRVRHLFSRGTPAGAARADLRGRGVPDEVIESALAELEPQQGDEHLQALALAQKRAASCSDLPAGKAFARVARYLCSRGYGPEVAAGACRSVFGQPGGD